jgi:hypothetical protein
MTRRQLGVLNESLCGELATRPTVGPSRSWHCRSPQPGEPGEPGQPEHGQGDAVPEHRRGAGVGAPADVVDRVDGARVFRIHQDGDRRADGQTGELGRVLRVRPGADAPAETERKAAANASIGAKSRSTSDQLRGCRNAALPKRGVDTREAVVAVPRQKDAIRHEEQAHQDRYGSEESEAPERPPPPSLIHATRAESARSSWAAIFGYSNNDPALPLVGPPVP